MKIGFIGLGIMGRAMALNLIKGGHTVSVWARRAESMQPLLDAGAKAASSASDAAQGNELVISMVADAPDVAEVMRAVAAAAERGGLVRNWRRLVSTFSMRRFPVAKSGRLPAPCRLWWAVAKPLLPRPDRPLSAWAKILFMSARPGPGR